MRRRALPVEPVVLWDGRTAFARGHRDGLPVFVYSGAPSGLMTRRQLRAAGLSPGRQEPVAVLRFAHRKAARRVEFAALYRRDLATPSRPASPAQRAALDRAMTVRRTCLDCGEVKPYCVPTSTRQCWDCFGDDVDRDLDGRDRRDDTGTDSRGDDELAAAVPSPRTSPEQPPSAGVGGADATDGLPALAVPIVGGPPAAPLPRPPAASDAATTTATTTGTSTAAGTATDVSITHEEQPMNRRESMTPDDAVTRLTELGHSRDEAQRLVDHHVAMATAAGHAPDTGWHLDQNDVEDMRLAAYPWLHVEVDETLAAATERAAANADAWATELRTLDPDAHPDYRRYAEHVAATWTARATGARAADSATTATTDSAGELGRGGRGEVTEAPRVDVGAAAVGLEEWLDDRARQAVSSTQATAALHARGLHPDDAAAVVEDFLAGHTPIDLDDPDDFDAADAADAADTADDPAAARTAVDERPVLNQVSVDLLTSEFDWVRPGERLAQAARRADAEATRRSPFAARPADGGSAPVEVVRDSDDEYVRWSERAFQAGAAAHRVPSGDTDTDTDRTAPAPRPELPTLTGDPADTAAAQPPDRDREALGAPPPAAAVGPAVEAVARAHVACTAAGRTVERRAEAEREAADVVAHHHHDGVVDGDGLDVDHHHHSDGIEER